MDIFLIVSSVVLICLWLWIAVIATLCLFLDPELEKVQRWGQFVVVLLVPFIGAVFILKLVNDHAPEVISRFYIPWPFRDMILDKELRTCGDATKHSDSPGYTNNSNSGGSGSE